jgi:hypothetical protein
MREKKGRGGAEKRKKLRVAVRHGKREMPVARALVSRAREWGGATRTRRRHIATRDKASPLHICRITLLLLRQRRGAAGLGELQWARDKKIYDRVRSNPARFALRPQLERSEGQTHFALPIEIRARALLEFPVPRAILVHGVPLFLWGV